MVVVKVGNVIAITLYLVNDVIGVTSLISRQWATSVSLQFGLWTFCDIRRDDDTATCTATSNVDNLGHVTLEINILVKLLSQLISFILTC
jgi:hypothetical protein